MNSSSTERNYDRIADWTRATSIAILLLHFYYYCYTAFTDWKLVLPLDKLVIGWLTRFGLFSGFHVTKWISLGLLFVSLIAATGKKDDKLTWHRPAITVFAGIVFYFGAVLLFWTNGSNTITAVGYISITIAGYLLILNGGTYFSRIIRNKLKDDIYNTANESFPQEQRKLDNEYSLNLPTRYMYQRKVYNGWINIINPFRGLLVLGSPGAGKSWLIIQHIVRQHIQKGFAMVLYDYKYDDLTKLAYNCYLSYSANYKVEPGFFVINLDDPVYSHRCNPLDKSLLKDIVDAGESARTILIGLNPDWATKEGDFWVESSILFLTALIWYLRIYKDGCYCTLPHAIELIQQPYDRLFSVLRAEPAIQNFINPFLSAYMNNVRETLDNQISSLKVAITRLTSPSLYYVLTGNDFSLDINNPKAPKILCFANNPRRANINGAVISLYFTTIYRLTNLPGQLKSSHIFDEFSTLPIYADVLNRTVATGRSNNIAITLCLQNIDQLKLNYGKEYAEVILGLPANIIAGQVSGETAKQLSERVGKIMQNRESMQINRTDTSFSKSQQPDWALPSSRIANLSSGEFVGVVADNPDQPIALKTFHGRIIQDDKELDKWHSSFTPLPEIQTVTEAEVNANYLKITQDIQTLVETELKRMLATPSLSGLVLTKKS